MPLLPSELLLMTANDSPIGTPSRPRKEEDKRCNVWTIWWMWKDAMSEPAEYYMM